MDWLIVLRVLQGLEKKNTDLKRQLAEANSRAKAAEKEAAGNLAAVTSQLDYTHHQLTVECINLQLWCSRISCATHVSWPQAVHAEAITTVCRKPDPRSQSWRMLWSSEK